MRLSFHAALLAVSCALPALGPNAFAVTAGQQVDIGSPIALTFYVAPKHPAAAEAKARSIQTPGSGDYHKFLTVSEFVRDYAVSDAELLAIEGSLENLGFTIGYVYPNHLAIEVLGSVGTAQAALGIHLQHFVRDGHAGVAPIGKVTLPPELEGKVRGVGGLNTLDHARPLHMKSAFTELGAPHPAPKALVGGGPGQFLPADFSRIYNLNPLLNRGLNGRGRTVGIVTLNDFNPADAYLFWKAIGLTVSPTRVTKVDVDGGVTAPGNNPNGEGETDLDVEYSGALASQADVRVYIAPNATTSNFINGFEAAASENVADTISTSWGQPELVYFRDFNPDYPSETYLLDDFHDVFLEMALQGQTLFAAAGDSGSFDTVRGCGVFGTPTAKHPVCNAPYAVDHPAADPLVTAAGGTTLPFEFSTARGFHVFVNRERAWGWDYLVTEADEQGFGGVYPLSDFFSVGGGGGVSSYFPEPWYQKSTPGIQTTEPGQYLAADFGAGSFAQVILPSGFAGRNLPDISANADPDSGYEYVQGGYLYAYNGGTSFVAPQLNGVAAVLSEGLGKRLGQLNPALYELRYKGSNDLYWGNNWGYASVPGYDDAVGVGTLNATKLFYALETLK